MRTPRLASSVKRKHEIRSTPSISRSTSNSWSSPSPNCSAFMLTIRPEALEIARCIEYILFSADSALLLRGISSHTHINKNASRKRTKVSDSFSEICWYSLDVQLRGTVVAMKNGYIAKYSMTVVTAVNANQSKLACNGNTRARIAAFRGILRDIRHLHPTTLHLAQPWAGWLPDFVARSPQSTTTR